MSTSMKVQQVTIQHFKNLEDVNEELNGANVLLLGDNGLGKSSFLQAIQIALGDRSSLPPNPITFDKDNAFIEVIAGADGQEYKFEAKFDRKTNNPILSVVTPDGVRDIRKSVIGQIVGSVDFNIDEFVNLSKTTEGKRKQVEIIKSFFDEETQDFFRKHEAKVQLNYNSRTESNRNIKTYKALLAESEVNPGDFKIYAASIDLTEKDKQYQKGLENNLKREDTEKWIKEQEEKMIKAKQFLEDNPLVDLDELREELEDNRAFNAMYEKVNACKSTQDKLKEEQELSGEYTVLIDTAKQAIEDCIKDIDMPVEGLSFDMEGLNYNGVSVDVASMSTSEIIHLGVQLKMARNPKVHVLCLEHGESLGTERLKQIQELCEKYDYQLILEQVVRGEEKLKIEIMPKV